MMLFNRRTGKGARLALMAVFLSAIAGGCADTKGDAPFLTGNTFDRYNELGVPYPESENVNISYEFGHVADVDIAVEGQFSGRAWLFSDNSAALPERFVILHLVEPELGSLAEVGRELSVGKGVFTVKDYCVTLSEDDAPLVVKPYVAAVLNQQFALSDSVFVRRYVSKRLGLDGKRLDVAFVEDVVRKGYTCDMFENFVPSDPDVEDFIKWLRANGDRSFEVVG